MLGWEVKEKTFKSLTAMNEWLADNPTYEPLNINTVAPKVYELGMTPASYTIFIKVRIRG